MSLKVPRILLLRLGHSAAIEGQHYGRPQFFFGSRIAFFNVKGDCHNGREKKQKVSLLKSAYCGKKCRVLKIFHGQLEQSVARGF